MSIEEDFDFGFSAVDADELGQRITPTVSESTSSEDIKNLELKLNDIITFLSSQKDDDTQTIRIEEKIDKLINMQSEELKTALASQSSDIRAVVEEVEERKKELNDIYKNKIQDLEKLIVPLIKNLMKNPEKEYILWPNRQEALTKHLDKIYSVTRSDSNIL